MVSPMVFDEHRFGRGWEGDALDDELCPIVFEEVLALGVDGVGGENVEGDHGGFVLFAVLSCAMIELARILASTPDVAS